MDCEFIFTNGRFEPGRVDPVADGVARDATMDWGTGMKQCGYAKRHTCGSEFGVFYDVWMREGGRRDDDRPEPFLAIVEYAVGNSYCFVGCRTWPDLMGLTAMLAPAVVASVLTENVVHAVTEWGREKTKKIVNGV